MAESIATLYVDIVPSVRGIQGQLGSQLNPQVTAAARNAGAIAGRAMGKDLVAASTQTIKATQTLGKDLAASFQPAMRAARDFSAGFMDSRAAASAFTGEMGRLGGQARKLSQPAIVAGQNFTAGFRDAQAAASALTGSMGSLGGVVAKATAPVQNLANVSVTAGKNLVAGFQDSQAAASALTGHMGTLGGAIAKVTTPAVNAGKNLVAGFRDSDAAASALTGRMGSLGGAASRALTATKNVGGQTVSLLGKSATAVSGIASNAMGAVRTFTSSVSTAFAPVVNRIDAAAQSVANFGTSAVAAVGTIGAVFGGLAISGGISRALNIEDAQAKLRGLGNSTNDVENIMDNALASVKGTSFGLDEAAGTAATAVASGIKPGEELQQVLTTVSNSAAAANVSMSDMGAVFGKAMATGKVQNDVLYQLADRNIPIYQKLAEQLGVTTDQVFKMASKGQIDFATFEKAAREAAGNVAFEMGKTTRGTLRLFQSAMGRLGAAVVAPFLPMFNSLIGGMTALADVATARIKPAFEGAASAIASWTEPGGRVTTILDTLRTRATEAAGAARGIIDAIPTPALAGIAAAVAVVAAKIGGLMSTGLVTMFADLASKIPLVGGAIGGLISRFGFLGKVLGVLGGPWGMIIGLVVAAVSQSTELQGMLGELGQTVFTLGGQLVSALMPVFQQLAVTILPLLVGVFQMAVTVVGELLKAVIPLVTTIISTLMPIFTTLISTILPPLIQILTVVAQVVGAVLMVAFQAVAWILQTIVVPVLQVLITAVGWVANAILTGIGAALTWFTTTAAPAFGVALAAVGGFFTWLWSSVVVPAWQGIQAAAAAVATWILTSLVPWVQSALATLGSVFTWLFVNVVTPVWNGIKVAVALVAAVLLTIWDGIVWAVRTTLAPAFTWLRDSVIVPVWNGIRNIISAAWTWIRDSILNPLIGFVRGPLTAGWNWLRNLVAQVWGSIRSSVSSAWVWIRDTVLNPLIGFVRGALTSAWNWLRSLVSQVWAGIRNASMAAWNWVRGSVLQPTINFLRGPLTAGWNWLSSTVGRVWDWISSKISNVWNTIRTAVFDKMTYAIKTTIPNAFAAGRDAIGRMWDGVKNKVKEPIGWVLDKVLQNGVIKHFNNIAGKLGLDTKLPNVWPIEGWRSGGYTGSGHPDDVAGVVHRDEQVIRSESRRRFERDNPGALDHINRYGSLPVDAAAAGCVSGCNHNHGAAGAAAAGWAAGGGPPGRAIWGPLQDRMTRTGRVYVRKNGALGIDGEKVAQAWMGRSALDVRVGDGDPQLYIGTGTQGPWGFYNSSGNSSLLQINPSGPPDAKWKQATAIHEMGHALSLQHAASTGSIMYPTMSRTWPSEMDYAALRGVFGNPGEGVKTYGEQGASGGWALKLIKKLVNFDGLLEKVPGGGFAKDVMIGVAKSVWDGVLSKIGLNDGGDDPDGEGAERWRGTVRDALAHVGLPTSSNYVDAWLRQIQSESGGNPRATQGNIGDINNMTGNLGKGLVQVIGSTFQAYRDKTLPNDQFHPLANLVAGMNWSKAKYGAQGMLGVIGHGHGYREGGRVTGVSTSVSRAIQAAASGVETTVFDGGGWLNKTTDPMLIHHRETKPDAVLTARQFQDMHALAASVQDGSADRDTLEPHFHFEGTADDPDHIGRRASEALAFELMRAGI